MIYYDIFEPTSHKIESHKYSYNSLSRITRDCPLFQTFPFFGVVPVVLNEEGKEVEGEAEGYIVSFIYIITGLDKQKNFSIKL